MQQDTNVEPKQHDMPEPTLEEFRFSEETEPLQAKYRSTRFQGRAVRSNGLRSIAIFVAVVLISLSSAQLFLLLQYQQHIKHSGESAASRQPENVRVLDCGQTVAEAKAKGCTWDELSKAWLPRECPRYAIEEYKMQGMLSNPHQNATSWPYYWDQEGTSSLNLDAVAGDENREIAEKFWTTSRQHLTHCASTIKRTIWTYENGQGHYDAISQLSHAHHCIDTLLRGAIRAEGDSVDTITTHTRVHVGYCTFAEWS